MTLAQTYEIPLGICRLKAIPSFFPLPRRRLIRNIAEIPRQPGGIAIAPELKTCRLGLRGLSGEISAGAWI